MKLPSVIELLQQSRCSGCSLGVGGCAQPKKVLGPTGSMSARIAVVGESPTGGDLYTRTLLSGQSGHLVREITGQLDIKKEDLYYSSALLCNYPTGKKPGPQEIAACNGRLLWDLRRLPNLKVVVAMGSLALQALTPAKSITREQYNVYWNDDLNCFVVPAYHPGMCYVNVEAFEDLVWSFERAKSLLNKPKQHIDPPPIKLRVAKNTAEALSMLYEIATISIPTWVAMDWEADDIDVMNTSTLAVGFSVRDGEAMVIPWVPIEPGPEVQSPEHDLQPTVAMLGMMHKIANNPNVKLIFHNGDFDVRLSYYNTSALFHISYDTILSDYALDERGGSDELEGQAGGAKVGSHRLKASAKRYLYVPDWEIGIKEFLKNAKVKYSRIPRPILYKYLGYDVVYTRRLRAKHEQLLLAQEPSRAGYMTPHQNLHRIMLPALNEIVQMEIGGIFINRDKAATVSVRMQNELADLETQIRARAYELGFPPVGPDRKPFNQRSVDDLAHLFYKVMKIKVTKDLKTKLNGQTIDTPFPTGRDPITKMRALLPDEPIFNLLLTYKTIDKQHGTYVRGILDKSQWDGNVHGQFKLTVARTGRLSSADPNLQNLPFATKDFYEPDHDGPDGPDIFFNADYKQLEVRVVAVESGDENLIAACAGDIHGVISKEIFAGIYEDASCAVTLSDLEQLCYAHKVLGKVEGLHAAKPYASFEIFRQAIRDHLRDSAKPIIFGVIYGREAYSLANGPLNCSEPEAQRYINALFEKFPDLHRWLEDQKAQCIEHGWIESFTGRRRRFSMMTPEFINRILKQAVNAPVQGGASDVCLTAFVNLSPKLRELGYGRPLLLVHDAIGGSLRRATLAPALRLIKHEMENAYVDSRVRYLVDIKVGPNYKDTKAVDWAALPS